MRHQIVLIACCACVGAATSCVLQTVNPGDINGASDAGGEQSGDADVGNLDDAGTQIDAGPQQEDGGAEVDGGTPRDAGDPPSDGGDQSDAGFLPDGSLASITGNVGGYELNPTSGLVDQLDEAKPEDGLEISLNNTEDFCGDSQQGIMRTMQSALTLKAFQANALGQRIAPTPGSYIVTAPGTYPKANERVVWALYYGPWPLCSRPGPAPGTSGSMTLTIVSAVVNGGVSGSVDIDFDISGLLKGAFNVPYCPGVDRTGVKMCLSL